ncbi:MAG TPA: RecX family transcriptional regulator [Anaerolineales bacterium]
MNKITAIEPQQKDPQRVNIYLDGEFSFGLARVTAGWLKVGQELNEAKIADLQTEDANEMTYQKALHFLSYRPRSSAEVRQNLTKRGIPEPLIEETVNRLLRAGLVNDQEFARAWVENRNTFHPRSKSALRLELRRKGLSDEIVQLVLDEQVDEESLAFNAARKYAPRLAGLEWLDFRQKLSGFLARRGFSYSTLSPVVSEVWKEIRTAGDGGTLDDKDRTWNQLLES